jgi:UDP-glucose 4-epimerase
MKILVTGANGFIGAALCNALQKNPDNIVVGYTRAQYGDIKDIAFGRLPYSNFNQIYHLAASTDNYRITGGTMVDIETNGLGTIRLLDSVCSWCPEASVVFVSSCAVNNGRPKSLYGASKLFAENACHCYSLARNLNIKIARPGNVYGVGERVDSVRKSPFMFMLNELIHNRWLTVYDEVTWRNFVYVDDVVSALLAIGERGVQNEDYDIGADEPIVYKDAIEHARQLIHSESKVTFTKPPLLHENINVAQYDYDTSKLKALGWEPKVSLDEGIQRVADYYG